MEVPDVIKRAKSDKETSQATPNFTQSIVGWDSAFAPSKKQTAPAIVNGVNDDVSIMDYEEFNQYHIEHSRPPQPLQKRNNASSWRISAPVGGRMLDLDPVFTDEEKSDLLKFSGSPP